MRFYLSFSPSGLQRKVLLLAALLPSIGAFAQKSEVPIAKVPANQADRVVETIVVENGGIEKVVGKEYTYVEQMPQLPGGGGNAAIIKAIQSQLVYPPYAMQQSIEGIVLVNFVVGENGAVRNERIVRGIGGGCDEQVLAAVRKLPRFTPGTQNSRPVTVGFTVPITFRIEGSGTTRGEMMDTLRRVYPMVNEMPHLPNGGGSPAIFRAVQQAVIMPPEVANDTLIRKVFIGFIVGPSGVIRDVKIVRSLNASCDAAAVAAVRKLPRFVGGRLNGLPASVSVTVPVLFGRLPRKP